MWTPQNHINSDLVFWTKKIVLYSPAVIKAKGGKSDDIKI